MRVSFAIGSLARGGAERQVLELASALQALGTQTAIHVHSQPFDLLADFRLPESVTLDLPGRRDVGAIRTLWRLREHVQSFAPDVLVTFLQSAGNRALLLRLAGSLPTYWVHSERGNLRVDDALRHPPLLAARLAILREAQLIVTNSTALGSNIQALSSHVGTKLVVIPNILRGFDASPVLARNRLAALGVRGEPIIGSVGSFQQDRNYELLVATAPLVLARHPEARFVIIGRTEGREFETSARRVRAAIERAGLAKKILLVGEQARARELIPGFDLFLLSSKLEGSSNALAEALVVGVPIAATPVADVSELMGGVGAIAEGWTSQALAGAIETGLSNPNKGRGNVLLAQRAPEAIARQWLGVLADAMRQAEERR